MKTAKEMYEIANPVAEVRREQIKTTIRIEVSRLLSIAGDMIHQAATNGQFYVECQLHSSYDGAVDEVTETLRNLGYGVTYRYDSDGDRMALINWYADPAPTSPWQKFKKWFWSWNSLEPK